MNLFLKHSHDLVNSVAINQQMIESETSDEGDLGTLDSDVFFFHNMSFIECA